MQSPATESAPSQDAPPPSASDYDKEKLWAEAHGVAVPAGKTVVIGKRRGGENRAEVYQDEIVVLRSDGTVVRFVASTKPRSSRIPPGPCPT